MGVLRRSGVIVESDISPMNVNTGVARPSRLYAVDGVTLKQILHLDTIGADIAGCTGQNVGEDGDIFETPMYARGNETKLMISTAHTPTSAIWDLYVNGQLDSSGYDDYGAANGVTDRMITLTKKINPGLNIIRIKVNGRNVSATDWWVTIGGMSIQ